MANTIKIKRSAVAGKKPATGDLALGELGLNTNDGKLFTKKSVGGVESIVELSRQQELLEYDTSIGVDYTLPTGYGGFSLDDVAVEAGKTLEIPDGQTWTVLASAQLDVTQLRDANRIYVAANGSDSNNGTSLAEPLLTLGAAAAAAQAGDIIFVGPGTYTEASLPIRWKRDVSILGSGLRNTVIKPAAGQEYNDIFKVDSGFYCWGLSFAGHQADTATGQQSWAVSFDELADNTGIGASGLGAYILKSPYVQNCTSITAEDDAGNAGSKSTGDTGGGINVDGSKCAANSPIRSMVVDSYTQVNLGGPGCLVQNDGYAQLVSFFGTFCTYHVKCLSGGQVNLSGGGTTDFGTYGLVADGYSPTPIFTGQARTAYFGATRIDKNVTITVATNLFTCTAHGLAAGHEVVFSASTGTLPTGITAGTIYYVISSGLTANDFRVSATSGGSTVTLSGTATGTYRVVRQGVLAVDVVSFGANRFGSSISRPNAGQLMFPQLVFPRNSTTKAAEAKTFAYTRTGNYTLTFTEAASASGPDHEYVSGGTAVIGGTNYGVAGAVYNKTTGVVTLTTVTQLPAGNGNVTVNGLNFICPTSAYVVTSSVPIDASGVEVANDSLSRAGYRVNFFNDVNGGLINSLTTGQVLDFRSRSQISAPSHTFEYVGSGTNYDALPWNGGVPVPANAIVEINNGKVYSSNTNEKGDFAVGSQFSVDGTTGTVTINTDQFNLSGLNFIGPFSRNGGFSTVGVQLQEVSNNTSLVASTGSADGNTVPTQFAVKSFYEAQASSTTPAANGTAAVGTSLRYARADHVHPSTSAGPLFRVNRSGNISGISSGALTKITFNVSTSNVESAFNLSTGVFQPATAGYYHVTFAFRASGLSIFEGCALIRQNGSTDVTKNCQISSFDTEVYTLVSDIIYLNGSTDYLEFYAQISNVSGSSGTYTITAGSDTTYACGFMIRPG